MYEWRERRQRYVREDSKTQGLNQLMPDDDDDDDFDDAEGTKFAFLLHPTSDYAIPCTRHLPTQVLMEGTPPSLNYMEIKQLFLEIDGIRRVHNLRVWNLSSNKVALSAHLAIGTCYGVRSARGALHYVPF